MTDTTNKLRAVFLTALMIGSVFAAGIAFTGTAAAGNSNQFSGMDASPATVTPDGSVTITGDASATGKDVVFAYDANGDDEITSDEVIATVQDGGTADQDDSSNAVEFTFTPSDHGMTDGNTYTVGAWEEDGTYSNSDENGEDNATSFSATNFDTSVEVTVDADGDSGDESGDSSPFNSSTGRLDEPLGQDGEKYSTETSVGGVGSGATIFQGEEDITFVDSNGNEVSPSSLERTGGANEGQVLELPIAQDAPTGTYAVGGSGSSDSWAGNYNVTVQHPRVTELEVQNNGRADVTGGILNTDQGDASVKFQYNYENAENVELSVYDEDGLEVTGEILDGDQEDTLNGDGRFQIDPSAVDSGEYTFTLEGVEDLDFGDATETVSVTISSSQQSSLNLANDEVVQGENLRYTIENSPEENFHAVTIESSDFRTGFSATDAQNIMRDVGDVSERGFVLDGETYNASDDLSGLSDSQVDNIDYAYAIVEIDDGNGVGSVETQYLDDSSVDIDLYPASDDDNPYGANGTLNESELPLDENADGDSVDTDDDESFDVTEGEVSLDSPTGTYVVGSEVDVNGTANQGIDDVALYARDNNDFELVKIDGANTTEVEGDDTFEEEDVVISGDEYGNDLLSLPGTYRLGVISAADADTNNDGNVETTLTTSDFNGGVSSTSSITVTDTELNGTFTTYNGQIASEDNEVDIEGAAPGKDSLTVAFVDSRGNVVVDDITVDSDGTFEEEDFLLNQENGNQLSQGTVSAHIISSGRDDVYGEEENTNYDSFAAQIRSYATESTSGNQVRDRILANSVDDTASDDLIVTEEFRLVDGLTRIESVDGVESGGTLTVEGVTNRQPDDNTITVELLDEDDDSVQITSTDQWSNNGQWSAEMDLANVEPGEYTIEADDGDTTDRQDIEIVEEVEETTSAPTTTEPTTTESTTAEPTTAEPTTTESTTTESTTAAATETTEGSGSSGSGIPGFGMGIALVAVLGAALLALRQN